MPRQCFQWAMLQSAIISSVLNFNWRCWENTQLTDDWRDRLPYNLQLGDDWSLRINPRQFLSKSNVAGKDICFPRDGVRERIICNQVMTVCWSGKCIRRAPGEHHMSHHSSSYDYLALGINPAPCSKVLFCVVEDDIFCCKLNMFGRAVFQKFCSFIRWS